MGFLFRVELSIVFSFHCATFVRILLLFTGTRQSLASIQHPCVNTKDINMSSSQPLSSNPEAQNAASQQFHEKPIPSQTNGTFQPPQAVRQRHQQGNASHGVSQRDHNYNSPIGGFDNLSTDGSVASLDPAVMEADPVADLDGHVRGAKTTTIGGVHKEDIEAQWPNTSQHEGR